MLSYNVIRHKGGENTKKANKRILFALILSILLLFSSSHGFAGENETISDVVSAPVELEEITQEHEISQVGSSQSDEGVLEAGGNTINVQVKDSYDVTGKTWSEDGVDLKGATVKLYDSSNHLVSTKTTDAKGVAKFTNLGSLKYNMELTYSTYNPIIIKDLDFTGKSGATLNVKDVMFTPDILLLVDYSSHNEKVDVLMNMSKRIGYISTTNFDESRVWLAEYASFIHIDMFAENSAYNKFTASYLKKLLSSIFIISNFLTLSQNFGIENIVKIYYNIEKDNCQYNKRKDLTK